jgi:hypothetical protein
MVATVKGVETQHEVVKNCFCMEGGQGETSYINNSQVQGNTKQHFFKLIGKIIFVDSF